MKKRYFRIWFANGTARIVRAVSRQLAASEVRRDYERQGKNCNIHAIEQLRTQ